MPLWNESFLLKRLMVRWLSKISGWCSLLLGCPLVLSQTTIDLSKPVSESLLPDGIYWSFDQGVVGGSEPEDVEDLSGNGMTGRILPGAVHPKAVYVKGKFGAGLGFAGVTPGIEGSDGIVRQGRPNPRVTWRPARMSGVGDEVKLDLANGSLTAGIWVKMDAIAAGEAQTVFLMHRGTKSGQWAFMLIKDKADAWKVNALGTISTDKTEIFGDGAWHHVGFVREVRDGESIVSFWIDGERLGSPVVKKDERPASDDANDRVFTVGERNAANFSTGFSGALDDAFVTSGTHQFKP